MQCLEPIKHLKHIKPKTVRKVKASTVTSETDIAAVLLNISLAMLATLPLTLPDLLGCISHFNRETACEILTEIYII